MLCTWIYVSAKSHSLKKASTRSDDGAACDLHRNGKIKDPLNCFWSKGLSFSEQYNAIRFRSLINFDLNGNEVHV